jgi:hypothetical protein
MAAGAFARTADAQRPANRFWMSLGGGIGHSGPANSTGLDQFTGPTGDVALGAALSSRGLIGLEAAGWHKDTPIGSSRSVFVSLTLLGYPFGSVLDNLYFQGGLGVGNASFPTQQTTTTPSRLKVDRPSLLVALGYDIPVACPLWITPFFQSYGTLGGHRITGQLPPGQHGSANAILFHAGVSLKYLHPGPKGDCRHRAPALTQQ